MKNRENEQMKIERKVSWKRLGIFSTQLEQSRRFIPPPKTNIAHALIDKQLERRGDDRRG